MKSVLAKCSSAALLAGAAICLIGPARAGGVPVGLHASDCLTPGIVGWYSGNALAGGMAFNPCPAPIPSPVPVPTAAVEPIPEPAPPVVVAAPPQRDPVSVPTYAPWSSTTGPGANAVGGGNGTASFGSSYAVPTASARALVSRADWCHRSGRSQAATDACIKSIGSR